MCVLACCGLCKSGKEVCGGIGKIYNTGKCTGQSHLGCTLMLLLLYHWVVMTAFLRSSSCSTYLDLSTMQVSQNYDWECVSVCVWVRVSVCVCECVSFPHNCENKKATEVGSPHPHTHNRIRVCLAFDKKKKIFRPVGLGAHEKVK